MTKIEVLIQYRNDKRKCFDHIKIDEADIFKLVTEKLKSKYICPTSYKIKDVNLCVKK